VVANRSARGDEPLLLLPGHAGWPSGWNDLTDPPRRIYLGGAAEAAGGPAVAIVGTRRATVRGLAVARRLAYDLVGCGWVVVSGLALGIDGAAHRGALAAGGRTVAVMATGTDRTYPGEHRSLRRRIERSGCTVTEYPPGSAPTRYRFPQRNRLIAALARAVIVVEAPARSGALGTAEHAADLGREVFAVPGPVDREQSRGVHRLLREGAHLLESVADLTALLGYPAAVPPALAASPPVPLPLAGSAARWIFDRLDLDGIDYDALRERWPGDDRTWCEGLLALEAARLIRRLPGGRLARSIWHS
jgi:DNA processing protein